MATTLYDDGNCNLSVEYFNGVYLMHCSVIKWNKSLYKRYKYLWSLIMKSITAKTDAPILAPIPTEDKKLKKFAEKFGWTKIDGCVGGDDGNTRDLYQMEIR